MAITRAQIARQLLANGGDILGPLGEDDLTNQLSPGTLSKVFNPGNIGRAAAFIMSGGLSGTVGAGEIVKGIAKREAFNKAMEKGKEITSLKRAQEMQQDNRARGIGGYQSSFGGDRDFMGGRGTAAEMGSFAEGGMIGDQIRQAYGIGDIVKKAVRGVKKVAKSPVGKAALLYTGAAGLGALGAGTGLAGFKANFMSPTTLFGSLKTTGKNLGLLERISGVGRDGTEYFSRIGPLSKLGIGGAITAVSLLPLLGLGTGDESEDEAQAILDQSGVDINAARRSILNAGTPQDFRARAFAAEGGSMDEPVAKKTMPLLDMGGKEMDLRAEGGFVPIGRMEKADDVPARLSKNEFVFTAEAVRNAGEGDVDKGAEVMYNIMKNLEAGGDVSEESQGLEGAHKMFQTSKRLEEVL